MWLLRPALAASCRPDEPTGAFALFERVPVLNYAPSAKVGGPIP